MNPLWMLRASRPVKARVSVVRRASALKSFSRCNGAAFDSSQARKAVPNKPPQATLFDAVEAGEAEEGSLR